MKPEKHLPSGWQSVRLADIGSFKSGSGFPLTVQGSASGDYPFFKVSDFNREGNSYVLKTANHYINKDVRRKIGARLFPDGTIVFAKIGAAIFLERKRLVSQESCLDNNMAGFILSDENFSRELILSNFQNFKLGDIVSSTALPAISSSDLKAICFDLPSDRKEQNAIAEALSDADALIEGLEKLIAKKRLIKQGAMQELLTGKRRLPGFSGDWKNKAIGSCLCIRHGKSQHEVAVADGPYPILATGGQIGTAQKPLYDKPSVLIGRKGTIDRPQYVEKPFWTVDTLFYSELIKGNIAKFFFYRFLLIDWYKFNEASGVPSLNARTIESIELSVPEPNEQRAIASILSDMDSEIFSYEAKLSKARQIKQGMMQELLTGRIRLV
ncbi:restriction endonuclease subunit S [Nisaea sp.]|uniref:restriction endonuclease subunit S n=1 Tax=Nisaea sp. TaxID=2024842 RepID=UPI002B267207|nr:restriction endonuclease subunit S [Nisaea sp.]